MGRGPASRVAGGLTVTFSPVDVLVDTGLGNTAYLVDLGDGRALVVDVSRDLRAVREAASRRGLRIAYAADSHLHADFLSGARQLAATDGTQVLASSTGKRAFDHTGLADGDEVDLGGLRLRSLSTPGHTDEHLAFLLLDGDTPRGVFTGGSLLVGSAARTDLVDPARTEELARAQYRSIQRLLTLPDHVEVWPTHGAGSFCSAPPGNDRTSTLGVQRRTNALLAAPDEDAFVAALLGSLGSYPRYFDRLGELNRRGPALVPEPPLLPQVTADAAALLVRGGAVMVDTRPLHDYAASHVRGALSIELRDAFATWLGWLVTPGSPVVLLRGEHQDPAEIAWQAAKVGLDEVLLELTGGIAAAEAAGLPIASTPLVGPGDLEGLTVVDVRQSGEFASAHLPGARNIELAELLAPDRVKLGAGPVVTMCGHGERALTGASLLERAGHPDVRVLLGGPAEWAGLHGVPLARGA